MQIKPQSTEIFQTLKRLLISNNSLCPRIGNNSVQPYINECTKETVKTGKAILSARCLVDMAFSDHPELFCLCVQIMDIEICPHIYYFIMHGKVYRRGAFLHALDPVENLARPSQLGRTIENHFAVFLYPARRHYKFFDLPMSSGEDIDIAGTVPIVRPAALRIWQPFHIVWRLRR